MQPSVCSDMITPERKLEALRHVNRGRGAARASSWEWAKIFPISVVLFFVIQTFLVEAFKIPSGSMERTLLVGDFLLVNKLVYGAELPFTEQAAAGPAARRTRGDVIVFEWPEDRTQELRQAAGRTAGRHARDARRHPHPQRRRARRAVRRSHSDPECGPGLGGVPLAEQLPREDRRGRRARTIRRETTGVRWSSLTQSYFVLGDNRDNSLDSRYWGFVPDSLVRGRPDGRLLQLRARFRRLVSPG